MDQIPRRPRESARDFALRFLKHNIINLHLRPGAMISAAEMAEATGISRTPIREAMQELEKTGILEIFPQAGSRISYIDYSRIHESCFIRQTLETAVADLACEVIAPADENAFLDILDLQGKCVERGASGDFLELDHMFHRQLYKLTDKMLTYRTLEGCLWHFDRLRSLSFTAVSIALFVEDHRAIFEAIRNRDKRLVRRLVMRHMTRYLDDERVVRAKYPDYFNDQKGNGSRLADTERNVQ